MRRRRHSIFVAVKATSIISLSILIHVLATISSATSCLAAPAGAHGVAAFIHLPVTSSLRRRRIGLQPSSLSTSRSKRFLARSPIENSNTGIEGKKGTGGNAKSRIQRVSNDTMQSKPWFGGSTGGEMIRGKVPPAAQRPQQHFVHKYDNDKTVATAASRGGPRGKERGGTRRGGDGRGGGHKKEWKRSAPDEFLLILTGLRAEFGQLDVVTGPHGDPEEVEKDIAEVITLTRALASRNWEIASESAATLCRSPLLDVLLSRMIVYAATQSNDPDLALAILTGMREKRIDPDAFMASLVAKAASSDRSWMPVVDVIRAQLTYQPGGGPLARKKARRHEGFTQALASAIERGKFYSSSFLVDALLQFQMVDLFTAKVALKFYRFSRMPARALPWISTAKAIGLLPDSDLDFEVGRVYKSLEMWKEAVALLEELYSKGRAIDDQHVGVVLSTCHQAGEWQECMDVLDRMKKWGLSVGRVSYLIILRLLLEKRRIDQTRMVLKQMADQGSPLDAETARLVLFSLAKSGPVHSSLEFLKLMRMQGVEPDQASYVACLRACARFNEPDRALEILGLMQKKGMPPDVLACATVMEALSNVHRWDEAFALFDSYRAQGLRPDIKCWTQVLHQATNAGRWDLFPDYLEAAVTEAQNDGTSLDLRFFATVINACAEANRTDKALAALNNVKAYAWSSMSIHLSTFLPSHTATVINACAEANRTDEAFAVLNNVKAYGLVPNVYCYSAAAKSCLARNRWRDALSLLKEAQSLNVPTDATLYRTVLRCCWQARQWKSVLQLYGEMMERGLEVDSRMYHQLMESVSRAGQTELAVDLLQEMMANEIEPLNVTVSAFLQSWYVKGEYDVAWSHMRSLRRWEGFDDDIDEEEEGEEVVEKGKRRNGGTLKVGPGVFGDLMAVCARREDWAEILRLLERMKGGVSGDIMVAAPHLVVRAYAELGEWWEAQAFLDDEMAQGKHSAAMWGLTYGSLLALCSKRIEPEKALEVLKQMEDRGIVPDADAYHSVLDACAQAGMTQEVRENFEILRKREGLVPKVESFTIMLELCTREGGKSEEAVALMDDLEALGLIPDMVCFSAAMDACRDAAQDEAGLPGGSDFYRSRMKKWRDQETMQAYNSEMAVLAARKITSSSNDVTAAVTAVGFLQEMQDNGIPRNTDSFNMALEACARARELEAAREVFDILEEQAQPDFFSYITLANALVRVEGDEEEATTLLNRMMMTTSVESSSISNGTDTASSSTVASGSVTTDITSTGVTSSGGSTSDSTKTNPALSSTVAGSTTTITPSPPSSPPSNNPTKPNNSSNNNNINIKRPTTKTRWPAYYRDLWPQTSKNLAKTLSTLANNDPHRCADIIRLLVFVDTYLPMYIDSSDLAAHLLSKGCCTSYLDSVTRGTFSSSPFISNSSSRDSKGNDNNSRNDRK